MTRNEVNWPVGIGVSLKELASFGALDGGMPVAGYELKPLLVLVDSQGKILWTDTNARHKHQSPDLTISQLSQAIREAQSKK